MSTTDPEGRYSALIDSLFNASPTNFGRLVYVAALCDSKTGHYRHSILEHVFDTKVLDAVLHARHRRCFVRWLELNLSQQRGDLRQYLDGDGTEHRSSIHEWIDQSLTSLLIPPDAIPAERTLFLHDVQLVMESIRKDVAAADFRYEAAPAPTPPEGPIEKSVKPSITGWLSRALGFNKPKSTRPRGGSQR